MGQMINLYQCYQSKQKSEAVKVAGVWECILDLTHVRDMFDL